MHTRHGSVIVVAAFLLECAVFPIHGATVELGVTVGGGLALACACSLMLSCNPLLSGSLPAGMADITMVQHVPCSGSLTCAVDPCATPRDVYFVFTKPSLTQNAAQTPSVASGSITVNGLNLPAPELQPLPSYDSAPQSLIVRIAEFNRNPYANLPQREFTRPSAAPVSGVPA